MQARPRVEYEDFIAASGVLTALRRHKGAGVVLKDFSVEEYIKDGDTYENCIVRIKVNCTVDLEDTEVWYIVKYYTYSSVSLLSKLYLDLFGMEAHFYKILIPKLNNVLQSMEEPILKTPYCYHVEFGVNCAAIFLQDMNKAGFKKHDPKVPLDKAHAELVVRELARFHASSRILLESEGVTANSVHEMYPRLANHGDQLREMISVHGIDMIKSAFDTGAIICDEIPEYAYVSEYLKSTTDFKEKWDEAVRPTDKFLAFRHGDMKCSNVLFKYHRNKPVDVVIFGFQLTGVGSNVLDLVHFMYPCMIPDKRIEATESLLSEYEKVYKNMCSKKGLSCFTKEELHEEYNSKKMFAFIMSICLVPLSMIEEKLFINFKSLFTPGIDRARELSRFNTLASSSIAKHPALRKRFLDLMDDFKNQGFFKN